MLFCFLSEDFGKWVRTARMFILAVSVFSC